MTAAMWKSLEKVEVPPVYLAPEDLARCYYARDYTSGGGFGVSEANSLVLNFKKSIDRKLRPEWHYRTQAVRQFARELDTLIGAGVAVTAIPSSALPTDPDYNGRFEDLFGEWMALRAQAKRVALHIEQPFRRRHRVPALHAGKEHRDIGEVYQSLEWIGFKNAPRKLVLVDDVITCGTHFKACQQLLAENCSVEVYGAFWGRTIWVDDEDEG
jgi:hypothetical protein